MDSTATRMASLKAAYAQDRPRPKRPRRRTREDEEREAQRRALSKRY